jgi:hypothetical protein
LGRDYKLGDDMQITYLCQHCYRECQCNPAKDKPVLVCPSCHRQQVLRYTEAYTLRNQVDTCAVCQRSEFYIRDEIRRIWGFIFLLGGVVAAYFTYGGSLIVGGLGFYWYAIRYPKVTICYHCFAKYRQSRLNPQHHEFELAKMEAFENEVRNDHSSRDFKL